MTHPAAPAPLSDHADHARPRARDIHEQHRVATPLEPLFDLSFVVAIAPAAKISTPTICSMVSRRKTALSSS